ncbi:MULTISPECIES: hypothetical protein [Pseudomonas putida group]|uniref:Uncharacterized protein n=1 Tax=Pseudomonas putida TaxID=303 RepID=A0A1Y3L8F5_PSEPU|nr:MULTISPECIES: hypothetical protein [Pseudomonas putida group]MCE0961768.1 hypothetical protein [Pseudomonas putida]MCE0990311.1 hypothetical protein [Pseudomonas alloputida]OUM34448.1 hypothetical protein B8W72_10585 [Pseudomonas putida]QKL06986.1 hypothetical protein GEV41_11350 [Pseudomonas putida]QNG10063.1 hypothetical protein GPM17_17195 [Pseudomonas putida]
MGAARSVRSDWGALLTYGLLVLAVIIALVCALYFTKFNSGLSSSPEKWSAFGSYFGGVLAPAISLITLFAVLRTIGLQLEQAAHFVSEGEQQRIAEYKACQLQLLDQQIAMYDRMIDRYELDGEKLMKYVPADRRAASIAQVDSNLQSAERDIARLIQLSVEVSLSNFNSIEELRQRMASELQLISPTLYTTSFS